VVTIVCEARASRAHGAAYPLQTTSASGLTGTSAICGDFPAIVRGAHFLDSCSGVEPK
jgi:hypothetical protein